jgi:class 3 adenylate cyclase
MNLKKLGDRIKERRTRLRLTQADVANALQISAQAVSKWERGENAPDISILVALARLLGVSVEWLLGETSPEKDTFEATVFCTSVNGFAERAASMPPRDLAAWANVICYSVTEAVRHFDGVPVKYVGDGFLGFFSGGNHADRAVSAARHAVSLAEGVDLVIALHTGEIYLGTIGHPEYASPDILGSTVNTAFLAMPWIGEHCPSRIGVTGVCVGHASDPDAFTRRGEVTVLGADAPVDIHEPRMP